MSEENKKSVSDSLRDWGIDVEKFGERAKVSYDSARGDLSEITGTLRQTLVEAKDVLIGLHRGGSSPAAAELKSGFERAWQEIDRAFTSARQKAKAGAEDDAKDAAKDGEPPAESKGDEPKDEEPPTGNPS
jgi:hypothetical protein